MVPWKRLVTQSLIPAGLNSPEMILPLLKNLGTAELAVVFQGSDVMFALPIEERRKRGLLSSLISPLTIMGTPHVDRDFPAAALTCFTQSLKRPLLLNSVNRKDSLWDHLATPERHFAILETWERAALKPAGTFESWLENNFDRKRRKEFRRLSNRLAEQGTFETVSFAPGDDSIPWASDLLALEQAGWKGKRGTAIAAMKPLQQAFAESCQQLAASGKLRFWKLVLDGKTIASMYAIVEADQAWLGKIAYDENLARYSPGVLLILYATEMLFAESAIKVVDSCAIPGHPMIENIWRDRLPMADVMLAPQTISAFRFAATVRLEKLRRMLRGTLRDIYYHLKGKKRS